LHWQICVRGSTVFQGYYKDEAQTREMLDAEGWLHTGDIGMWLEGGRLKIIDRKKNIFKLAQVAHQALRHCLLSSHCCPLQQQDCACLIPYGAPCTAHQCALRMELWAQSCDRALLD
jgi:non-ribosomal peptide synthetase component E (peptide arylation enzyme)